jgi:exopolysaccharide biosynthesis polyprenyl glycosylphosphotransferase
MCDTRSAIRDKQSAIGYMPYAIAIRRLRPLSRPARRHLLLVALLSSDVLSLGLAFLLAYAVRFSLDLPVFNEVLPSPAFYTRLVAGLIPLWLITFVLYSLYDEHYLLGGTEEYARVFNACTGATMAVVAVTFLYEALIISRGWLILSWFFTTLLAGLARFSLRRVIYWLRCRGHLLAPALIVGANQEGQALAEQLQGWATSGLYLAGFVDDRRPVGSEVLDGHRVLGRLDDLERIVTESGAQELVIAPTALSREQLVSVFRTFGVSADVRVRVSSGLFEIMTTGLKVKELSHVPLISLNKVRLNTLERFLKATMDRLTAAVGLIVLMPAFLVLGLLIKRDSPGPAFHRRRVLGVGGKEFEALKFRTMFVDGDEILDQYPALKRELEEGQKLRDDPRVTWVGKWLRKYSLDELPQLFNVLRGQMSLVGPRMITPGEQEKYGKWDQNLLTVKPGMTGLWQVSGRSDVSYEERVRLDMYYIRNYTIWLDLQILFQTIPAVLKGRGAY